MRRLILPILVLAGAIAADRLGVMGRLSAPLLVNLSRTVFALVLLLAWRFQRGRVAWAVVFVAVLSSGLSLEDSERDVMDQGLMFLLPLNFAVLGMLQDWRIASGAGIWRLGVLATQVAGVWTLERHGLASWLGAPLDLGDRFRWLSDSGLPGACLASLLAGMLVLAVCLARRRTPIEAGLAGAVAAAAVAFSGDGSAVTFHFAVAGLILGLSVIENAFSLAYEDALTGLPARRSLEETLRHLGRTYSIAMVDLDLFKKFNDRHGHEVGDQVLQMVAVELSRVGGGGKAFRYGGEEFSVIFPGKTAAVAEPFVEELRKNVAMAAFTVRSPVRPKKKPKKGTRSSATQKKLRVTVSIGLAERTDRNRLPDEVMKAADKALYRSKKAGRNRVTVGR